MLGAGNFSFFFRSEGASLGLAFEGESALEAAVRRGSATTLAVFLKRLRDLETAQKTAQRPKLAPAELSQRPISDIAGPEGEPRMIIALSAGWPASASSKLRLSTVASLGQWKYFLWARALVVRHSNVDHLQQALAAKEVEGVCFFAQ